jgi:hypothetical protein
MKLIAHISDSLVVGLLFLQASCGVEAQLTRCTLRKHGGSHAPLIAPYRFGAVALDGPALVTLQDCYVEVGCGLPVKAWPVRPQ